MSNFLDYSDIILTIPVRIKNTYSILIALFKKVSIFCSFHWMTLLFSSSLFFSSFSSSDDFTVVFKELYCFLIESKFFYFKDLFLKQQLNISLAMDRYVWYTNGSISLISAFKVPNTTKTIYKICASFKFSCDCLSLSVKLNSTKPDSIIDRRSKLR